MYTKTKRYVQDKIFDNNLVAIRKSKITLKLYKTAFIGMCKLDFSKKLIYQFHYDYVKSKCDNKSKLLFTDTDSLMYEMPMKMSMKILTVIKKCLTLVIIRLIKIL